MRAILVCVDFADLLALTLPRNRKHFEEFWVVTADRDAETQRVATEHGCNVFCTDSFWAGGAAFNKWAALEQGLDRMGRKGWLCLLDADVVWPESIICWEGDGRLWIGVDHQDRAFGTAIGQLCSPLRRMAPFDGTVPPESQWPRFPIHRNVNEWAGYTQIFHADDPAIGPPPWHEIDWRHAGGADSFFQAKWSRERKVRPPFEVLHLGEAGQNWYGRATAYADGRLPEGAADKRGKCRRIWVERTNRRRRGLDQFELEKLPGDEKAPPQV